MNLIQVENASTYALPMGLKKSGSLMSAIVSNPELIWPYPTKMYIVGYKLGLTNSCATMEHRQAQQEPK